MSLQLLLQMAPICALLLVFPAYILLRRLSCISYLANIPGPPSASWWTGNFFQVFNRQGWRFHHDIAAKYGNVIRLHYFFGTKALYVSDPRALHHIVVKDQHIYEETPSFIVQNTVVFGPGLLSTLGDHHRKQRKMLNPVFSMRHMRDLLPKFYPIAHQLRDIISRKVCNGESEINMMKWMSLAALEYIGQGGFGYSFDALDETKTNKYMNSVRMLGPVGFNLDLLLIRQAIPYAVKFGSARFWRKFAEWGPSATLRRAMKIIDVMDDASVHIFRKKKEALIRGDPAVVDQVESGKDIMSVLLRANMSSDDDRLPDDELVAQMNTFVFAGHGTTTSAICRVLHQLVLHPEAQEKLRSEVINARKGGDLDYDTLMSLPYLDAVCRETFRVHPPIPFLQRMTTADVTLPLLWPIKSADGEHEISEIPLKKGTNVFISVIAANRNKTIWGEDAETWRPERWLEPMPESVCQARLPGVYASMMTFLGGGRACIGFKFAEMEMKMVLSILLESFAFSAGSKEIYWNMSGLQSPVIKGSVKHAPELPMRVSFAPK